jgi:hypothetical protein
MAHGEWHSQNEKDYSHFETAKSSAQKPGHADTAAERRDVFGSRLFISAFGRTRRSINIARLSRTGFSRSPPVHTRAPGLSNFQGWLLNCYVQLSIPR